MENRYADLFRFIFMLNYFVLLLFFTGVTSAPVTPPSIIDIMRNDSKLCLTSKFLFDSKYIKLCESTAYPTASSWEYDPKTLNNFLCLGINDTAYKICQYSSQLQIPFNNTAFDSYVEKYVRNENKIQEDFCKSLQGFTSLYNKTDSLWEQMVKSLNTPYKCARICFDFENKFHPLCAVFAWIDDIMKSATRIETKHELVATDKSHISQSKDGIITTPSGSKKTEAKESKEQNRKPIADSNNNNNIKEGNSNVPGNTQLEDLKFDEEKIKSRTEKANSMQKNINNTSETQTHKSITSILENKENIHTELDTNAEDANAKSIKDNPPNSDSQASTINKVTNNINKNIINGENLEKKEQNINIDLKPSTLSENTQDHYDAENPEENMENDIADVADTIQHPDTGNQNENVQEVFEQKNNNARLTEYSNMRTEDDSHFFTYLTVITLACLAGYIGYHNKQKIFAIVLEGRRSRNNRGRRRPSTASYRKLDCTLEEAVTSQYPLSVFCWKSIFERKKKSSGNDTIGD